MTSVFIANEAYKLTNAFSAEEISSPSELISGTRDTAAFQIILNDDKPYSVSIGKGEWFSNNTFANFRRPHERLRVSVEAPFPVKLNIEELVTDDDGIRKADILLDTEVRDSAPCVPSAVFAEVCVPRGALPGEYEITVRVFTSLYAEDEQLACEKKLKLRVFGFEVPDYRDWKFHLDLWQHNSNIARHYDVKPWSDEHFAVLERVVDSLAKLGQKSITVIASQIPWSGQFCSDMIGHGGNMFEYSMIGITKELDGTFVYDYTVMQRYIDLCTEKGMIGDIEVFGFVNLWVKDDLGTPTVDYIEPIRLRYLDLSDGKLKYVKERETVEDYIRSLERYFKETNQLSRVRIAADEPSDMVKYRKSLEAFRSIAPSFRFKTAINHAEFIDEFGDAIDDFVPYLYCVCEKFDILKQYQRDLKGKRFLWYVCCGEGRPNTQMRQHLTESRMIGPMNYRLGFDGFLRWAYTIWPEDPRHEARYSRFECGDTHLVYPSYNGGVLLSLRYKNLRRGIVDYELLSLLAERGKSELAERLVADLFEEKDLYAYYKRSFADMRGAHTHSFEDFNKMKADILTALCE